MTQKLCQVTENIIKIENYYVREHPHYETFQFFVKKSWISTKSRSRSWSREAVIMPRNQYGRADINFRSFFQDFNMSKFVVYTSLLIFSMLFALRKDGVINWSWWSIFIPLFVWKGIAGMYIIFVKKCLYVYYTILYIGISLIT